MRTNKYAFVLLLSTLIFSSCSSDDDNPAPVNEEEVITTLTITLVPEGGGETVILQSRDLDGDGPDAPVITVSGSFSLDTAYNGSVTLLNETETPPDNITLEVQEEDDEHQFFYTLSNIGTISYADMDANGNPVGLMFTLQTVASALTSNGILTVELRHEPAKNAPGVSDGDITNAGGETDIEASFNVSLQ